MSEKKYPEKPILCVDDHEFWLVSLEALLSKHCNINNLESCSDGNQVMPLLARNEYSLVLLDYEMPDVSGEDLLPQIVNLYPDLPVIVLTGHDDVTKAVRCMELGATNYYVKTDETEELANFIQNSLLAQEMNKAKATLEADGIPNELISEIHFISPAMQSVCVSLWSAVRNQGPITFLGEKGVGKQMLAKSLLKLAGSGNFVMLDATDAADFNCTDPNWVKNLDERVSGGVVYIRNIDSASFDLQREFLVCLQSQKKISGTIIIALEESPEQCIRNFKLRPDLANLLKMQLVEIPPLRERKEDIPFLTHYFMKEAAEKAGKKVPATPAELELLLNSYHFPGNVGELEEMIYKAIKLHKSRKLSMVSFKQAIDRSTNKIDPSLTFSDTLPTIEQAIDILINEAEERAQGNQTIMANMLGISRPALNKRLQKIRRQR